MFFIFFKYPWAVGVSTLCLSSYCFCVSVRWRGIACSTPGLYLDFRYVVREAHHRPEAVVRPAPPSRPPPGPSGGPPEAPRIVLDMMRPRLWEHILKTCLLHAPFGLSLYAGIRFCLAHRYTIPGIIYWYDLQKKKKRKRTQKHSSDHDKTGPTEINPKTFSGKRGAPVFFACGENRGGTQTRRCGKVPYWRQRPPARPKYVIIIPWSTLLTALQRILFLCRTFSDPS